MDLERRVLCEALVSWGPFQKGSVGEFALSVRRYVQLVEGVRCRLQSLVQIIALAARELIIRPLNSAKHNVVRRLPDLLVRRFNRFHQGVLRVEGI